MLRAPRRSKAPALDALKTKLGKLKLKDLTRERLIQFGKEGASPVTISMDIGYIKLVVSHAAAVHGVLAQIDLARIALKRLGIVGKGRERDRRPPLDELQALPIASPAIRARSSPWDESCVSRSPRFDAAALDALV